VILGALLAAVILMRGGPARVAKKMLRLGDTIGGEPVERVAGAAWRFQAPPRAWYVSNRSFPNFEGGEGVTLERVVVRPEGSAVALLFSTRIPRDRGSDLDALSDTLSKAWEKKLPAYRLLGVEPLPGRAGTRVLHFSARIDDEDFEALSGLYPNAPMFYWLVVGASPRTFTTLREELEGVLVTFTSDTLPPEPAPTATYLQKAFSDIARPRPARPR
jgi:hypothetical protein